MSAFFVHDLKNTAFTLNLMLQNLPMHFDDPAFREDALRGCQDLDHINRLIDRLGRSRHELQIKPVGSGPERGGDPVSVRLGGGGGH